MITLKNLIPYPNMTTAGWSAGINDTKYSFAGTQSLRLDGTASVPEIVTNTRTSIAMNPSHIYYVCSHVYYEQALSGQSYQCYWPIAEPSFGTLSFPSTPNQWVRLSFRGNRSSFTNTSAQLRFDYNNNYNAGSVWYDGAMLIDLTETFGAGKEPTKEYMDAIPFFMDKYVIQGHTFVGVNGKAKAVSDMYVGVQNIARKASKVYVGVNGVAKLAYFKAVVEDFVYSGAEQTFTIPESGVYSIEAIGAGGSKGNTYSGDYNSVPGKGGKITGTFNLVKGDVLHLIIGGVGSCTKGTAKDGASGGGGGGTFIFREIASITNSKCQFAKSGKNYEVLLVAPGGGGSWDESYKGSRGDGKDGLAAAYKSLDNYVAWSTESSTSATTTTMGITQYITNNAVGGTYSRGSSTCKGGYGCGGAQDDAQTAGGGWSGSNTTGSYGWSLDTNAVGVDGVESGNGSVHLERIGA